MVGTASACSAQGGICPLQRWHDALTTYGPSLPTSTTRCCRARSPGQHTWPGEGGEEEEEEEEGREREKERQSRGFFFSQHSFWVPLLNLTFCVRQGSPSLPPPTESLPTGAIKVRLLYKVVEFQFALFVIRCVTVSLFLQSWGELQHSASAASTHPF